MNSNQPRAIIEVFAEVMEDKLEECDWKPDWRHTSPDHLMALLIGEVSELAHALRAGNAPDIAREAADVANYAMMVADRAGALHPTRDRGRLAMPADEPGKVQAARFLGYSGT